MFTLNFLRRCYGRRIYLFIVLISLDILTFFYSEGIQHPYTRHLFLCYDLVSGLSNILYWIILFVPIGVDIIQEKSSFGVSLFCRISKPKYMLKQSVAVFIYCICFFGMSIVISYVVSYVNGYETGTFHNTLNVYIVLVLLGNLMMVFVHMLAWLTDSSYAMTSIYAGMITALQIPEIQEKISVNMLAENILQSTLCIVCFTLALLFVTVFFMNRRDCIGIKKGMSI